MKERILSLGLALVLAAGLFTGCGTKAPQSAPAPAAAMQKFTVSWFDVFDTVTTVLGYAESQEEWDRQMEALHNDLIEYHRLYDIYNRYEGVTNLYDVNLLASEAPVRVDSRIFEMLTEAVQMYSVTQGKMNVAMGQVYSLWHHARDAAEDDPSKAYLPDTAALAAAAEHGSIADLILNEEDSTVYFADPELRLDVGSVGKGYAVEMAARAAEERGLTSALLSVGGNLRSIGTKPDGTKWSGGIQNPWQGQPGAPEDAFLAAVEIEDMALVTSGDYQRFFTLDGVRYHHLIDPDTQQPARNFSAVAVLTPDSGLADCLSTGLFCLDLESGLALVEELADVEAMWMQPDGKVIYSSGFEKNLK